jgi:ATP-dependent Clp protease protease subunit
MNLIIKEHTLLETAKLKKSPVIIRVNDFTEASVITFNKELTEATNSGQPIIPIVIDSYGGEVYSLLAMIDLLQASKIPIATIIEGKAMSCGAFLASFGTIGYRFAGPNSTILIHEVAKMAWGKLPELKASVDQAQKLNNKVFSMLDKNCNKAPGTFEELVHRNGHADLYLDTEQALAIGLIDHIQIPSLSVEIKVQFEFK